MLKKLYKLAQNGEMASIYTDKDQADRFHFGKIIAINEFEIAIEMFSPYGDYDGIVVLPVSNVYRIETKGQYYEKMEKICKKNIEFLFKEKIDNKNIIKSTLKILMETKDIVSIELCNSGLNDVIGLVDNIDFDECCIKQVDEYGFEDGYTFFDLNNITQISFLRQEEILIKKLHGIRNTENGSVS